jgi:biotin carboxyl carrier protein
MPGLVVTVSVTVGQTVKSGDPLASIEAMKMDSQIRSDRDGVVKAIHVKAGEMVAARDCCASWLDRGRVGRRQVNCGRWF